jgi:hypothetical protein
MELCLALIGNNEAKSFYIYFSQLEELKQWRKYIEIAKIKYDNILKQERDY